jgi:hypothetical protein
VNRSQPVSPRIEGLEDDEADHIMYSAPPIHEQISPVNNQQTIEVTDWTLPRPRELENPNQLYSDYD